ncbi:probable LRR receptor-like serine/threonine-protein kinase [Tanacetum coccineum]
MGDFEKIVRVLGKFRHDNLVRVRGFVWGEHEKLVIYDYVSNGSLATSATYILSISEKVGASLCQLSFEVRLKIAKGIANGLAYIHEKKHVHGNIKPSNVLLTSEMDPMISDFGLEWLISGKPYNATIKSARNSSSKRSISSREEPADNRANYINIRLPNYQAPEAIKTEKPNAKWDVYSFGVILLELLLGKVLSNKELGQWNITGSSIIAHNEAKILKIVDGFATTDLDKKDSILTCIKLGFNCANMTPQKRPSMKEALQVLEKIPCQS